MRLSLPRWGMRGLVALAIILAAGVFAPAFVNAQSKSEAQLAVRIQELEDQVRTLTGQIEGLQFSLTQMQTQLQQMADDNEFRFQQLEGGAGGKTDAATQSGGVTPPGEAPQPVTGEQLPAPDANGAPAADAQPGVSGALTEAPIDAPIIDDAPMDDLGDSADPLLGQGGSGDVPVGTLGQNGVPLDLSLDSGQALEDGDANAQYAAGYDAIVRGDYAFAEEQFRQFVALYPKDPQAPDAANWLGEALLQRQAYDEAADVLLTGFQNYEKSARAPDLLFKLGIALAGAGELDTACRTFFEVTKRYPHAACRVRAAAGGGKAEGQLPGLSPEEIERLFEPLELYEKLGLAVSGGPDSLALLVLAEQWARGPGRPRSMSIPSITASGRKPPRRRRWCCAKPRHSGFPHGRCAGTATSRRVASKPRRESRATG